ncbi:conserved hypothetical protein [Paecilomyces variotii No. 5]|uniref:Uncharacterized protein n=1 Tax=Byssochlamys spectabilis (strain No. 5 / NBRC 109023) TaxID=1356009 RepID=V5I584_BYSSN|nr:conserved hypothetical protein [Paecilomyces variotii No. 5]
MPFWPSKRVILRLRVSDFDNCGPAELDRAIMAYLSSTGHSVNEISQRKYYSHIEPFQPPDMKQKTFHIVLGIEKDMLKDPDFEQIEHEVHRDHRATDRTLIVDRIQNRMEEQNFVNKMQRFTNIFYPWAK